MLTAVAVLFFAAIPLWLGLMLQRPARMPAQPAPRAAGVGVLRQLLIKDGPRLVTGPDGRTYVFWRTSAPADSLVTYGRVRPTERVAAMDGRLLVEHSFALPDDPFARLCRVRVMSAGEGGRVANAELGPGAGGTWNLFQDAGPRYEPFRALGAASCWAWEDYDGDGRLDAATFRPLQGEQAIEVIAVPRAGGQRAPAGGACLRLHWADFNADGRPDLLAAGDRLTVYWNGGPPGWRLGQPVTVAEGGAAVLGSAVADADADGLPDVLALNAAAELVLYLNHRPLGYALTQGSVVWRQERPPVGGSNSPAASAGVAAGLLVAADFTGDGRADVCVGGEAPLLLVQGADGWAPLEGAFPQAAGRFSNGVWAQAADWDGDGHLDLLLGGGQGEGLEMLRNDGVGRFEAVTASAGELADLKAPLRCAAWADLDGNGYLDLIVGLAAGGARLYLNNGKGQFMDATGLCALPVANDAVVAAVSAQDLNGDCAPDLQVRLDAGGALLFENRWRQEPAGAYVKVRPVGLRGVCGSTVILRDESGGRILASASLPEQGAGPAEHCFGVEGLDAARVEVLFSDGARASALWRRGQGPSVRVERPPEPKPQGASAAPPAA